MNRKSLASSNLHYKLVIKFNIMKIYTKTGDKGETGVVGGRVKKDSIIIETIGTFDELNATLGIIVALNSSENSNIIRIQNIIFCIGSIISGTDVECDFVKNTKFLENNIDKMNSSLEELSKFILPGGSILSANIHLSRTVCRRSERKLIEYLSLYAKAKPKEMIINVSKLTEIQKFTNRLSDYLFVLSRYENHLNKISDIYWDKSIR